MGSGRVESGKIRARDMQSILKSDINTILIIKKIYVNIYRE